MAAARAMAGKSCIFFGRTIEGKGGAVFRGSFFQAGFRFGAAASGISIPVRRSFTRSAGTVPEVILFAMFAGKAEPIKLMR